MIYDETCREHYSHVSVYSFRDASRDRVTHRCAPYLLLEQADGQEEVGKAVCRMVGSCDGKKAEVMEAC